MKNVFSAEKIRKDFPILSTRMNGKPLIYLDNAATSQKPKQVLNALNTYYSTMNANAHRGLYDLGLKASHALEESHVAMGRFIGASDWREVAICKNATEGLNAIAFGLKQDLKKGDEILVSKMEHHSNLVPWQQVAKETGAVLKFINVQSDGALDWNHFEHQLSKRTKIVAVTNASNVLGVINDPTRIAKLAHSVGAVCVVDGCQSTPHMKVNVKKSNVDFFAFSGHKMMGPSGIGAWYVRADIGENFEPFLKGGDMISSVTLETATWNDRPFKFEAGTQAGAEAWALKAAIEYLEKLGMDNLFEHEKELFSYAWKKMHDLDGVTTYGPAKGDRLGIIPFNLDHVHPHDVATILNADGICVRAGDHCAQPLMRELGMTGSCRASFYAYTTKKEIDALVSSIQKAQKIFA